MRGRVNLFSIICILAAFLMSFSTTALMAWETPMVVANKDGHKYYKPELGFGPDGSIWVAYREKGIALNSDIIVCHYDGVQMTYENISEGQTFYNSFKNYESDIEVLGDGSVHVVWALHNRNNKTLHHIKYRYKDGNTWSPIINLGDLHFHGNDVVFDLRLGVDNNRNVHVVLQEEHNTVIRYLAKYGDTILEVEEIGNPGSRKKHPDIAVTDDYVQMNWMRKLSNYVQMTQKRDNRLGGEKGAIRQLTFPKSGSGSQKSRIDLDSQNKLHLAEFYKTGIIKKLKYYQELDNGQMSQYVNLSSPDRLMLYHWAGIEVRDNSKIVSFQLGSSSGGDGVYYNWHQGGSWGGYSFIPGTKGAVHQSVDLSADGTVAGITYGSYDNSVMLVTSGPIVTEAPLQAEFNGPATAFYGDSVTFDASQCNILNPDANIVSYVWDFGDGTNTTTTAPTVQHTYNTYGSTSLIKLTIVSDRGDEGSASREIQIEALYSAVISDVKSKKIRSLLFTTDANVVSWKANPKNVVAGYPDIVKFQVYRAPVSSVLSESDYVMIAEVSASVNKLLDYKGLQANTNYVYAIVSVDSEGHISPLNRQ